MASRQRPTVIFIGIFCLCSSISVKGNDAIIDDDELEAIVSESKHGVDNTINRTIETLRDKRNADSLSPGDLLTLFRLPDEEALELIREEEEFEQALDNIIKVLKEKNGKNHRELSLKTALTTEQFDILKQLSPCVIHERTFDCEKTAFNRKYRRIDGTCNNRIHPLAGAALTPYERLLLPRYEDGLSEPVGWNPDMLYNGHVLPSPRMVSNKIMASVNVNLDVEHSYMLMFWGQLLDHDLDSTPISASNAQFNDGVPCNATCKNERPCFPIQIPHDDPRIHHNVCMGFTRSGAVCGSGRTSAFGVSGLTAREQLNQITSFIDASNVYGSSDKLAELLRDLTTDLGLLREGVKAPNGKGYLPFKENGPLDCQGNSAGREPVKCFLAGDGRANENIGLISLHTIFMRYHNKLAKELKELNPHWSGDTLFQEARKIVGAVMQHISYSEYLPEVVGPDGMEKLGTYSGYDNSVSPSIVNVFATAAFRFGHGQILPLMYRLNEEYEETEHGNLPLALASFASFRILKEGGLDPVLRGMHHIGVKKMEPGHIMSHGVTEKLFRLSNQIALDLAALNIQRGRDHGLPSYNAYREFCGLKKASGFGDLADEIKTESIRQRLGELYGHPDNIDLFVGGMAEDSVEDGSVGPTFQCILVEQFNRLRDGDRFWYENPGVFTSEQLEAIKKMSLSSILCENNDGTLTRIQKNVFTKVSSADEYIPCDQLESLETELWQEK